MHRIVRFFAPILLIALVGAACGDDDGGTDPADGPTGGGMDGPRVDASNPSDYTIRTCGEDPAVDAGPPSDGGDTPDAAPVDAPEEADAAPEDGGSGGGGDGGSSWPGLDEPCCDPTGTCPGDLACVVNREDMSHRCRPRCDVAAPDCPELSRCLMFDDGMGVCLPAGQTGDACSPEFCAAGFACVGRSADEAFCRPCCSTADECQENENCAMLNPAPADCPLACVPI